MFVETLILNTTHKLAPKTCIHLAQGPVLGMDTLAVAECISAAAWSAVVAQQQGHSYSNLTLCLYATHGLVSYRNLCFAGRGCSAAGSNQAPESRQAAITDYGCIMIY